MAVKYKKKRSPSARWDEKLPVKIYGWLRDGMAVDNIQRLLRVSPQRWKAWIMEHPTLANAIKEADDYKSGAGVETLKDYIYGQLPEKCKHYWNKIMSSEEDPDQRERTNSLLYKAPKIFRQQLFLYAFIARNFNSSEACRLCGIPTMTLAHWTDNDKDFKDLMDEFHVHKGNFFESALIGLVAQGDSAATIFANKTFNKDRGYGEKLTIEGSIDHKHTHILVDELNLPVEVRQQILDAMRKQQEEDPAKVLEDKTKDVIDADFTTQPKDKETASAHQQRNAG